MSRFRSQFTKPELHFLRKLAEQIVQGDPTSISLHQFYDFDNIINYIFWVLQEDVEALSTQTRSIRRADPSLFASAKRNAGLNLWLAVCKIDHADGEDDIVTRLTDDMVLVSVGPYSNGYRYDVPRATPEQVAKSRETITLDNAQAVSKAAAEDEADVLVAWMVSLVRDAAEQQPDGLKQLLVQQTLAGPPTVVKYTTACKVLNIGSQNLLRNQLD